MFLEERNEGKRKRETILLYGTFIFEGKKNKIKRVIRMIFTTDRVKKK